MFGAPPPPSAMEIRKMEEEASMTIQQVLVGSILLYLSPFAIDTLKGFL
ncbi:hypothetical protein HYALB_00003033 [Hymenoscyphus albidus]|uniref:Mitochondrial outer membrane translocase complex, subunit Tom5 n=2 Tax=Hymenoscyphus TaxID=5182 RepID=A0A9N9KJV1_9HELO|nr:hypothetical protein HYFRA_00002067 [Hymenoscyphus fraxineus]CAG8981463.1 hypothetical protein HYALB_00003033 [Hymenoscyphus albidus]